MNNKAKTFLILLTVVIVISILSLSVIIAKPNTEKANPRAVKICNDNSDNDGDGLIDFPEDPGCTSKNDKSELGINECDDGIDNDGDGNIDTADSGCTDAYGVDESDCGDSVCEGGETQASCPEDCGYPDSCEDSDGSYNVQVQGTTSGYLEGNQYSYTDFCNGTVLTENYCIGDTPYAYEFDCVWNYTSCSNGACV